MQGMSLVPAVTELMLAELMYLQYDNPSKPVYMYINSAGVQVEGLAGTAYLANLDTSRPIWLSKIFL